MQMLTISDEVVPAVYSLGIKQRFSQVQLVLGCGDLPIYYLEFMVTMLAVPCLYVHGNHDRPEETASGEQIAEARGCLCVEGRSVWQQGLLVAGLGGSLRYNDEGRHQYSESQMAMRIWRLTPHLLLNRLRYGRYLDLFLTHAPPLGIHNGNDYPHRGFRAFLRFMDRFRPRYLIHGHIHQSYGYGVPTATVYGATRVINTAGYRVMDV